MSSKQFQIAALNLRQACRENDEYNRGLWTGFLIGYTGYEGYWQAESVMNEAKWLAYDYWPRHHNER